MPSAPKVAVYRNLHRALWSVRDQTTRLVLDRVERCVLIDAVFRVGEKSRQRALREGRRNVHAFVIGQLSKRRAPQVGTGVRVRYNAFRGPFFTDGENRALASAGAVLFEGDGTATAYDPVYR